MVSSRLSRNVGLDLTHLSLLTFSPEKAQMGQTTTKILGIDYPDLKWEIPVLTCFENLLAQD